MGSGHGAWGFHETPGFAEILISWGGFYIDLGMLLGSVLGLV